MMIRSIRYTNMQLAQSRRSRSGEIPHNKQVRPLAYKLRSMVLIRQTLCKEINLEIFSFNTLCHPSFVNEAIYFYILPKSLPNSLNLELWMKYKFPNYSYYFRGVYSAVAQSRILESVNNKNISKNNNNDLGFFGRGKNMHIISPIQ